MIALDTNIVVRVLVRDDPKQYQEAERLLVEARERGEPCFLSDPVLCEVEWVLESCYDASREDILTAIRDLLEQDDFLFEDRPTLLVALRAYQQGRADFSDYLIGAKAQARGARVTYSFDRKLRQEAGFKLLT